MQMISFYRALKLVSHREMIVFDSKTSTDVMFSRLFDKMPRSLYGFRYLAVQSLKGIS